MKNFLKQVVDSTCPPNESYYEKLILLDEEIILFDKTKCRVNDSGLFLTLPEKFYRNYYVVITNFRIVIYFDHKTLFEDKVKYISLWYPTIKSAPKITFIDNFLLKNYRNKIISGIKYDENKKGKFIKIRVSSIIPSFLKIYNEKSELIYNKIYNLINNE